MKQNWYKYDDVFTGRFSLKNVIIQHTSHRMKDINFFKSNMY